MICDPQTIPALVRRASEQHGLELAASPQSPLGPLLLELERVATTRAPIIFWGEPGVGRTTLARAVHAMDGSPGSFARVRCAFQDEVQILSTLSAALHDARGGTLLLESLEDLPTRAQLWLCDTLEARAAAGRVREADELPRIIATSTIDPTQAVEDGDLAEELFYLLGVFVAPVPPLRWRRSDIPVLAQHFLERANTRLRLRATGFSEPVVTLLARAPWHGNASELRNVVEHGALLAGTGPITLQCLPAFDSTATLSPLSPKVVVPVGTSIAAAERQLILATLEHTGFNKAEAARTLQLDVKTVRAKLRSYGV